MKFRKLLTDNISWCIGTKFDFTGPTMQVYHSSYVSMCEHVIAHIASRFLEWKVGYARVLEMYPRRSTPLYLLSTPHQSDPYHPMPVVCILYDLRKACDLGRMCV
jgi:hypothetical protein